MTAASLKLRFTSPVVVLAMDVVGGIVASYFLYLAWNSRHNNHMSKWCVFIGVTGLLAVALAVVLGGMNYERYLRSYFEVSDLNSYENVDPSRQGNQWMDGGRLNFVEGTIVDVNRTMGFVNFHTYCVAPISATVPTQRTDFWAVGMDCCGGGTSSDFNCGQVNDPDARSGLRLMHQEQQGFFRLAVQQAQMSFGSQVVQPQFFHWVKDADVELASYQTRARTYSMLTSICFFLVQLLAVLVFLFFSSKH